MIPPFNSRWAVDYEFSSGKTGHDNPLPVCYVATNVDSGETIRHWIAVDERAPEYPTGPNSLFIAYYASAEMGCHISLHFPRPVNILDLFTEFRVLTNSKYKLLAGRSLIGALTYFGMEGTDSAHKEMMRERILQGPPFSEKEKEEILDYCGQDVDMTVRLFKRMEAIIDWKYALFRGRYMWACAMMEHYGIPVDTKKLSLLINHWDALKGLLITRIDRDYNVYEDGIFRNEKFVRYLESNGIPWEFTESGLPRLDKDYLREQCKVYSQLDPFRELRITLSQLQLADLSVGSDGRNRLLLSPFGTITGRHTPSNSGYIFGPAKWIRYLIKPRRDMAIAYVDYEQQEIGIAAALSSDPELKKAYASGDPYSAFAKVAGAMPANGSKKTHPEIRERYKTCMLALNYGQGVYGFANKSGLPLNEANHMLHVHRTSYAHYWKWIETIIDTSIIYGKIENRWGWYCNTHGMKHSSLLNWPMQSCGSAILQVAILLCLENDIKVCAPVHDAILIESPINEIESDVEKTQCIMSKAAEYVIGYPLRTEAKIVKYPDRYEDDRGRAMWNNIWKAMEDIEYAGQ